LALLLGCSVPHFLMYLAQQFRPGMRSDNHGEWEIDHIRPCSLFDLTDPEQRRLCFHYTNLQPLWSADNMSKGPSFIGPLLPPETECADSASRAGSEDVSGTSPEGASEMVHMDEACV